MVWDGTNRASELAITPIVTTGHTVAGFTLADWKFRAIEGAFVGIKGRVTNATGSAIVAGASGNIAGDPAISLAGLVPAAICPPSAAAQDVIYVQGTVAGVATLWFRIQLDGSVSLTHALPTYSWGNTVEADINDVYFLE